MRRSNRRSLTASIAAAFCCLGTALCALAAYTAPALAYEFGSTANPLGPQTVVDRCADTSPPDQPVHAYRDGQGAVHLILSRGATWPATPGQPVPQDENRRLTGPELDGVAPVSCQAVLGHEGVANEDPASYHWREWIAAPYRLPGTDTVHALVHTEFHPNEFNRPDLCTYGRSEPVQAVSYCWLTAFTLATSADGGATFDHAQEPPAHLVANIPYQYEKDSGATGYRAATNILKRTEPGGDFYYAMFDAKQYAKGAFALENQQEFGTCIMRTGDLADPTSWRAWDGDGSDDSQNGFTVQFAYPYPTEPGSGHVCKPVNTPSGPGALLTEDFTPRGLTYNSYFGRYLLLGNLVWIDPTDGKEYFHVIYSLSSDLLSWTAPQVIMRAPTMAQYRADGCTGPDVPIVFPSLVDPSDTSVNFERPSQTVNLYYVRREAINPNGCTLDFPGFGHKLVRIPIRLGSEREASGRQTGCAQSFDRATSRTSASSFLPESGISYSGDYSSYRATVHPAGASAYGVFDRDGEPPGTCEAPGSGSRPSFRLGESDDITYAAAFKFPTDRFWRQIEAEPDPYPSVSLLRFEDTGSGDWAGMLTLDQQRRLRFSTSAVDQTTKKQLLGPNGVQLPRDECWHLIEVHQTLSSDPAKAVNEVWVDGVRRDVPLASDANYYGGNYNQVRVGIAGKASLRRRLSLYVDAVGFGHQELRSAAFDPSRCDA